MNVIDEVKERLDIVEVISAYVPLKRAGRHYKGLCPFHAEKTPSFVVFPETGTWYCFGACGTGGDVFTFLMRRENLDFREALEHLARLAGVPLPAAQPHDSEAERHRERLRAICAAAARYYHHLLFHHPQGTAARAYLSQRGITEETMVAFQLGYALDDWEAGQRHLLGQGYTLEELAEAGLVVERQHGRGYYDRFRGRVMIPICDVQGRVIGFGARALGQDEPKYLNSPQTPIFDKSRTLFGLDKARQAIRAADQVIIVEGYMDVITAHQHGYANVVASMGTALTEHQLRQLKRYTRNFTLALDPDVAGRQATLRGLEQAREALDRETIPVPSPDGLMRYERRLDAELRILTLPEGQDPDEVIRRAPDQWPELVKRALPIIDFYLQWAAEAYDLNTAHGKASAVATIAPLIREVADEVIRQHYIQQLARRIQVEERVLERQILRKGGNGRRRAMRPVPTEAPQRVELEEYCLLRIMASPELREHAAAELAQIDVAPLHEDDFERAENRAIFSLLQTADPQGQSAPADQLPDSVPAHWTGLQERIAQLPPLPLEHAIRDLVNAILRLRLERIRRSLSELRFLLTEAQEQGDHEAARDYTRLVQEHTQEMKRLQAHLAQYTILRRRAAHR